MKPDNKKRRKRPRRPDGYFANWEQKRVLKAKNLKRELKKIRTWIDRYLEDNPEYRHLKSVMMLWIMMKRYNLSIRVMIAELYFSRGSRKVACLKWIPSKSWLHKWMNRLPLEMLDAIVLFTAKDGHRGILRTGCQTEDKLPLNLPSRHEIDPFRMRRTAETCFRSGWWEQSECFFGVIVAICKDRGQPRLVGSFLQGWLVGLYSKCGRLMAYYAYYSIDAPPMRQCRL